MTLFRLFEERFVHLLLFICCHTRIIGCMLNHDQLNTDNVSYVINSLLKGYDKRIPPSEDGSPVNVNVGIYITDMVPTELTDLHYSVTFFFRESWKDVRLAYDHIDSNNSSTSQTPSQPPSNSQTTPPPSNASSTLSTPSNASTASPTPLKTLTFNHEFFSKIWKPDLFTPQLQNSYFNNLLVPNIFVKLRSDGLVFKSQMLTLKMYCNMDLSDFPFDHQLCKLRLQSYAYTEDELRLHWMQTLNPATPPISKNMIEYNFDGLQISKELIYKEYGTFGSLVVSFRFSRHINYYLLQMYLPCCLIVILSWVGFWIDYRSTPARVALGITTVLTMITFSNSVKIAMPSVDSSKLIDWYFLVAFFYVFMGLVEFVIVGLVDSKWKKRQQAAQKKGTEEIELQNRDSNNNDLQTPRQQNGLDTRLDSIYRSNLIHRKNTDGTVSLDPTAVIFQEFGRMYNMSNKGTFLSSLKNTKRRFDQKLYKKQGERKREGIHVIDRISRYLYPLTFLVFNIVYFSYAMMSRSRK